MGRQGRTQDLAGGGGSKFFSDLKILRMTRPCALLSSALLGGFGGMLPSKKFKLCNLVRFGVYLNQILSLIFFLNYRFFI